MIKRTHLFFHRTVCPFCHIVPKAFNKFLCELEFEFERWSFFEASPILDCFPDKGNDQKDTCLDIYWLHTIRLFSLDKKTIQKWVRGLFFSLNSSFLYSRRLKEWEYWLYMKEMAARQVKKWSKGHINTFLCPFDHFVAHWRDILSEF